ncbi:hypothetical protein OIO90_000862 [Microbotryomycetes sp. JL221]|nr:hypothetical protein OIO90_000862 [Microbotryomycetes sp. JL221]
MTRTASSLSRERSPSTSGLKEGREGNLSSSFATSVTPRGPHGFPFSAVTTPTGAHRSPDPSVTPSSSRFKFGRHSLSSTSASDGDDEEDMAPIPHNPEERKKQIVRACTNGQMKRLRHLLTPRDTNDSDVFLLANQLVTRNSHTPLHLAAGRGYVKMVQYLVEDAGALPEVEDSEGETALHKASYRGHLNVCQYLIERGVSVNVADRDGWTPLHNAASRGWLDIARLLADAGATIDASSKHRYTPLSTAASKGQLPLVNFLLKRGADPSLRNAFNETAYDLAASVFELSVCSVLAQAEQASQPSGSSRDDLVNPLVSHSTYPVVVHENQRLARPTLKKVATLGALSAAPVSRWSSKALSRSDRRTAFTLPHIPGLPERDLPILLKTEVGLPVVGSESKLIIPALREAGSGGKIGPVVSQSHPEGNHSASPSASRLVPPSSSASTGPNFNPSRRSSSPTIDAPRGEPAWFWLSDWTIDLTDPKSSPVDGWSYARSFDAGPEAWQSEAPDELHSLSQGDASLSLGSKKWVRRRRWVRIMRRRLDVPNWGFTGAFHATQDAGEKSSHEELAATLEDYRARARFLAGERSAKLGIASQMADQASIRSGKTVVLDGESTSPELDRAELRKAAARLERAIDELRAGVLSEVEDVTKRQEAERELETFLHQLATVRTEIGPDLDSSDSDMFIYTGTDALGSGMHGGGRRPSSVLSAVSSRSTSVASLTSDQHDIRDDFIHYSSQSSSVATDLTPQLSAATEFRVPTNDAPMTSRTPSLSITAPSMRSQGGPAQWEDDDLSNVCRRCDRRFTFFLRKHHCRRCGLLVCSYCSAHADLIDPAELVHEPGTSRSSSYPTPRRGAGSRAAQLTADELFERTTSTFSSLTITSPSPLSSSSSSSATGNDSAAPSEAGASDTSELSDCPVCGAILATLGHKEAQEAHIRDCLETGGGSIAHNGRYLTFKLQPGPLVGRECSICFEEFDVDERLARLACLCYFHATCIKAWLERGKSCPVHAVRDMI